MNLTASSRSDCFKYDEVEEKNTSVVMEAVGTDVILTEGETIRNKDWLGF